jgi:hypothetical protein
VKPLGMTRKRDAALSVQENMTPLCTSVEQEATLHVKSNSGMWRIVVWEIFTDIHIEADNSSVFELSVY